MTTEITDQNFQELVLQSKIPVVIDFWAEWCGPCRMVAPILDDLSTDYKGKAFVGKVNVDTADAVAERYGIRNIPTILFIKNGEVADKQVGAVQKSVLAEKLEKLL